jgi:hypothetical protein
MKKFIIKSDETDQDVEFIVPSQHTLAQVLEHFTIFLRSCNYEFDGYVTILPYDDWK